jgi:DNA-binding CsgD family transcriptional regulator
MGEERMSGMTQQPLLRPVERRVVHLLEQGLDETEIAARFRRSPDWVLRVASLARMPRSQPLPLRQEVLRPLERRVLRWRSDGAVYADIAPRFRRSPAFVQRVEDLARYKLRAR